MDRFLKPKEEQIPNSSRMAAINYVPVIETTENSIEIYDSDIEWYDSVNNLFEVKPIWTTKKYLIVFAAYIWVSRARIKG